MPQEPEKDFTFQLREMLGKFPEGLRLTQHDLVFVGWLYFWEKTPGKRIFRMANSPGRLPRQQKPWGGEAGQAHVRGLLILALDEAERLDEQAVRTVRELLDRSGSQLIVRKGTGSNWTRSCPN